MPYAAKAKIEHEFETNLLNVWVTFRHPMDQSLKPLLSLWLLDVDDVVIDIVGSDWQDAFTLLLTSDALGASPERVLLEYAGPSSSLQTTWGKDWEPWGPILSVDLAAYRRPSFVDRGDPDDADFRQAVLTTDATWRDLDLSLIIPEGASAVLLKVSVKDSVIGRHIQFRKNDNINEDNTAIVRTQASNVYSDGTLVIALDANRVIEYHAANVTYDAIAITVSGWFF